MAENITIARPYAQAVFDLAVEQKALPKWSDTLSLLNTIVSDEQMHEILGNPSVKQSDLCDLVLGVCGSHIDADAQNMVKLLVENGRLNVIADIVALYEQYRAEEEKIVQANVVSAFPLSDEQKKNLTAALAKKLGRDVSLDCDVDKSLMGGAIIRAGDMVIDGSVTDQLAKLGNALAH